MDAQDFRAERHSGYFRRSLAALRSAGPGGESTLATLQAWTRAPLAPEQIDQAVRDAVADVRARQRVQLDPEATGNAVGAALRRTRRLLMMTLIERDVSGAATLDEVCTAMTAFAASSTREALRQAGAELAARFGTPADGAGAPQDLIALGMGKGGADELNVSSDLDLIFVHRDQGETTGIPGADGEPVPGSRIATSDFFTRLARRATSLMTELTADGFVFRVDTRLRPNGDAGPLVVSLAALEDYFYTQGREWERFAWLKANPIADSGFAGEQARRDDELSLAAIVRPFVFRRYLDFRVIGALRDLHAMIRSEVARRSLRNAGSVDVKLGRGGIREIEFTAQLFQIVRGGRDPGLRDRRTLATLAALAERDILSATDAAALADAYRLLRRTEHAIQYREDAQTHRLPADPDERAAIAAMLGMSHPDFESALETARSSVQRVFDDLLRDPADEHDGAGGSEAGRGAEGEPVVPDSVRARLDALRAGARYRNVREETRTSIETVIGRALSSSADEAALARLVDLVETVIGRPAYIALLSQFPQAQARVMKLLGKAKWAAEYLNRHPIVLDELLDGQVLAAPDYALWELQVRDALAAAVDASGPDVEQQMDIVREGHHAQVFRLLVQDLEGLHTVERLADHLSELADRVLSIALDQVWPLVKNRHRDQPRFAVIAYGKLGGKELGYSSDLDLVYVYDDDDPRAAEAYSSLATRLAGWISARTAAGLLFEIDLRLRPNGNAGLMVTSLKSFCEYQRESAWVWEHQALTRARFAAGDAGIGRAFEDERRAILARERDPVALRGEVLAMRARMHEGHPNRSQKFDLKHDDGGMVDIEFIVQYLVLAHSHRHPELLDNKGNIALLARAGAAGLVDADLAARVADAYREFRQLQHTLRLNDAQYARVEPDSVAVLRDDVRRLWAEVLGTG